MLVVVTYDLRTPDQDYDRFHDTLKRQGRWWHYLSSTWLLSTKKTPQQIFDALEPHLGEDDRLFIAEITDNHQGWLPKKAWDWIERHGDTLPPE